MGEKETAAAIQGISAQLGAIDSRIRVMAQRMNIIEKNEQIIGKTLIGHNKKLKELESGGSQPGVSSASSVDVSELRAISEEVKKTQAEINSFVGSLKDEVLRHKETIDKMREEINEMKYVLDNINPVAYVTVDQVGDLIDEKLRKLRK
jgi:TolA-binding protein